MDQRQRHELTSCFAGVNLDADMGEFTTFRAGARVEALVDVAGEQECVDLLGWMNRERLRWRIIGGGSNILVTGASKTEIFLRLKGDFLKLEISGAQHTHPERCTLIIGGGCSLAKLVRWCEKHSLTGMEWAVGIPGTIGGAIFMNAGAHGYDMSGVLLSVKLVTACGRRMSIPAKEIGFDYRSTRLPLPDQGKPFIITGAELMVRPGLGNEVTRLINVYRRQRREKQPKGASAGSFFKNPPGDAAGRLIEKAGLKGVCYGGAQVSPVHANFIVNTGAATPEDILALKDIIQKKVRQDSGILLEPEVQII